MRTASIMTIREALISKFILSIALFCVFQIIAAAPTEKGDFELIVLHNNDMHARFEQTNVKSNKCQPKEEQEHKCFGGFARTAAIINNFREKANAGGTPVVYLNAGDTYTGTPWFSVFKDNITSAFLNLLRPDAASLGNHEFDLGVKGLLPLLKKVTFPVVTANLDLSLVPELLETGSLKNSTIIEKNGVKIGIVGYLTPDTKNMGSPNDVKFYDEISSINRETPSLKSDGASIIIALGHSGYETDQRIAMECPDVDLVIGGHSHSFLYTGAPPSTEVPEGPYPTVVENKAGKKVLVVQAYAYTKYMGYMKLKFNANGNLIQWEGAPILLNGTEDAVALDLLNVYKPTIENLENSIVGRTNVVLDGERLSCRRKECNLGNLLSDSMVHARTLNYETTDSTGWNDVAIAFIQGGGIRAGIDKGNITRNDILSVLPFENQLYALQVTGKNILEALEKSASNLDKQEGNGGFLQMSGVHVVYDASQEVGKRVHNVTVLCTNCTVPHYEPLQLDNHYKIILSEFILRGGDGYEWNASELEKLEITDTEAALNYIRQKSPVYPSEEGRIELVTESEPHANNIGTKAGPYIFSFLIAMSMVVLIR